MKAIHTFLTACAFLPVFSAQAAEAGRYQKIEDSNCTMWTPVDGRRFSHWSGNCRDGKADGKGELTGEWQDDKGQWRPFRYQGGMALGKRSGIGHNRLEGGAEYNGQWRNNNREGWGLFRQEDGSVFEGQWRNDLQHGIGTRTGKDGSALRGRWVDGELAGPRQLQAGDGSWWSTFAPHADGAIRGVVDSGSELEAGEYKAVDGRYLRNGLGVYYWTSINKIYLGNFTDNKPDGEGTFVVPDKDNPADADLYSGTFDNGCIWRGDWYTAVLVASHSCRRP